MVRVRLGYLDLPFLKICRSKNQLTDPSNTLMKVHVARKARMYIVLYPWPVVQEEMINGQGGIPGP